MIGCGRMLLVMHMAYLGPLEKLTRTCDTEGWDKIHVAPVWLPPSVGKAKPAVSLVGMEMGVRVTVVGRTWSNACRQVGWSRARRGTGRQLGA